MAETSLFPLTPQSSPQRRQAAAALAGQGDVREGDREDLRRRQSVRFVGPCSVQTRVRRTDSSRDSGETVLESTDTQRGREPNDSHTREDPGPQRPNPPQRAPPPVPLPKIATGYLDALSAGDEYYTPEDDIASAPSSYRRLRASRSSILTGPQSVRRSHGSSGELLASGSLKSRPLPASTSRRFFRSEPHDGQSSQQTPTLRAPKSMSFLSSRRSQSKSSASQPGSTQDNASSGLPDLPEDGASTTEQSTPRPRYKSSTLFGSLNRQSDLKIRKSLRGGSSAENFEEQSCSSQQHADETASLRSKARKVSRSLRIKLKSLFVAKSDEEAPSIPRQHIESRRSHVTPVSAFKTEDEEQAEEDCTFVHSPPAKVPILRSAAPGLVHSNKASLESLKSERDRSTSGGSSLTSWVHSGPSTLTSLEQRQWREWEKQRLSVIRENGAHAPSPSVRRRGLGSGVFQPPEAESAGENVNRVSVVVDSQRIYSALVKRMQAMNTQDAQGQSKVSADEDIGRSLSRMPDTIRRVTPGRKLSRASDDTATPTRASKSASLSRGRWSWDSQASRGSYYGRLNSLSTSLADDHKAADNDDVFTREDTLPNWRPRLAGSPASHLFRTGSPYRRALGKSMQEEQNAWAEQRAAAGKDQAQYAERGYHLPESASESAKEEEYSESVYSSDEGESGPGRSKQTTSMDTPATYRAGGCREASTASSVEWKTWLSANIDKFEPGQSSLRQPGIVTTRPGIPRVSPGRRFRGHVREAAQIDDDEHDYNMNDDSDDDKDGDDVLNPSTTTTTTRATTTSQIPNAPWLPTPLANVQPNVPSPLRRSIKQEHTPPSLSQISTTNEPGGSGGGNLLLEKENESPTRPPPPPQPPIPARSKLRPEPLRIVRPPSVSGNMMSPSMSVVSSPGLSEALQRQWGSLSSSVSGSGSGYGSGRVFYGDRVQQSHVGGRGGDGFGYGYQNQRGLENRRMVGVGIAEVLEADHGGGGRGHDESVAFV